MQPHDGFLQQTQDSGGSCWSAQDECKLVAAQPGDRAGVAESLSQAHPNLAQACIAGLVAERIV